MTVITGTAAGTARRTDLSGGLTQKCPFFDDETPSWNWCGRPCMCRKWIKDPEARAHSYEPGVAKAPNYRFDNRRPKPKPEAKAVMKAIEDKRSAVPRETPKPVNKPVTDSVTDSVTDKAKPVTDKSVTDKAVTDAKRAAAYRKRNAAAKRERDRQRKAVARMKKVK
jgi:hypothetical protein